MRTAGRRQGGPLREARLEAFLSKNDMSSSKLARRCQGLLNTPVGISSGPGVPSHEQSRRAVASL